MISPQYVDGLELRIRELVEKGTKLEAERDALVKYAKALRHHWDATRDYYWDGPISDVDEVIPPPRSVVEEKTDG